MTIFDNMSSSFYYRFLRAITLLFLVCFLAKVSFTASIRGKVIIDDSWEPVIYLSAINSFDDFNTVSFDFLVHKSEIDSVGFFEMNDLVIPDDNRIYRLHICKKNDPVSTIIIGGRDENFIHFIMNNQTDIEVVPDRENPHFQYCSVKGNNANNSLLLLMHIQKEQIIPPALPSKQNREFLREQTIEKYKLIADTSSHDIIKLLAIDYLFKIAESPKLQLMEKTAGSLQISDTSNPYYRAFVNNLEYVRFQTSKTGVVKQFWFVLTALVILITVMLLLLFRKRVNQQNEEVDPKSELLKTLSVQERKVFDLLKNGASNKEISLELNIEVNTVKSHIYKIFTRLGVKSRKEIVNGDW